MPVLVLAGALLAVFSGYLLGEFLFGTLLAGNRTGGGNTVSPPDDVSAPKGTQELTTTTVDLAAVEVFRVQLGAFANREGAERHAADALAKQVPAHVVAEDKYRVIAGIYASKAAAAKAAQYANNRGLDTYVYAVSIPGGSLSLRGVTEGYGAALRGVLSEISASLRAQMNVWGQHFSGQPTNLAQEAQALEASLRKAQEQLASQAVPQGWDSTHKAVISASNTALKAISEMKAFAEKKDQTHLADAITFLVQLAEDYEECLTLAVSVP